MCEIEMYFLLFMIYAIIGWGIEVIGKLFQYHKFINRGFLIGPYCPIYGYGALIMTLFLQKYKGDWFVLFGMSMLICSFLEYITSYVMEKWFHARWWDYSQYKFHLNGRICLKNAILFGIGGCFIIEVFNPIVFEMISFVSSPFDSILSWFLFVIFMIDNIVSFKVMTSFKKYTIIGMRDNTEEMNRMVLAETKKISKKWKKEMGTFRRKVKDNKQILDQKAEMLTLKIKTIYQNKSYVSRRLIDAFPNFKAIMNMKAERKIENEKTKLKRSKNS